MAKLTLQSKANKENEPVIEREQGLFNKIRPLPQQDDNINIIITTKLALLSPHIEIINS